LTRRPRRFTELGVTMGQTAGNRKQHVQQMRGLRHEIAAINAKGAFAEVIC
jgi:hypothetical protein